VEAPVIRSSTTIVSVTSNRCYPVSESTGRLHGDDRRHSIQKPDIDVPASIAAFYCGDTDRHRASKVANDHRNG
jgi:hypothetical protein